MDRFTFLVHRTRLDSRALPAAYTYLDHLPDYIHTPVLLPHVLGSCHYTCTCCHCMRWVLLGSLYLPHLRFLFGTVTCLLRITAHGSAPTILHVRFLHVLGSHCTCTPARFAILFFTCLTFTPAPAVTAHTPAHSSAVLHTATWVRAPPTLVSAALPALHLPAARTTCYGSARFWFVHHTPFTTFEPDLHHCTATCLGLTTWITHLLHSGSVPPSQYHTPAFCLVTFWFTPATLLTAWVLIPTTVLPDLHARLDTAAFSVLAFTYYAWDCLLPARATLRSPSASHTTFRSGSLKTYCLLIRFLNIPSPHLSRFRRVSAACVLLLNITSATGTCRSLPLPVYTLRGFCRHHARVTILRIRTYGCRYRAERTARLPPSCDYLCSVSAGRLFA